MASTTQNILLLSHERSLNKAQGLIEHFKLSGQQVTLLTDHLPDPRKAYVQLCDQIIISPGFHEECVIKSGTFYDRLFSISENLLPTQSRLEQLFEVENINPSAARILSNKFEFFEYCRNLGFSHLLPTSIIPTRMQDLDSFIGPMISKPDIGTGHNSFFSDYGNLDYRVWKSSNEFLSYLIRHEILDPVFDLNRTGLKIDRFNNKPCKLMIEEFLMSEVPTICPCGHYKNGRLKILFFVQNIKVFEEKFPVLLPLDLRLLHEKGVPKGRFGDFAVVTVEKEKIDERYIQTIESFLINILDSLQIGELFFSGPDFHISNGQLKCIDFNPRIGNFFNQLNLHNDGQLFKIAFDESEDDLRRPYMLWATLTHSTALKMRDLELDQLGAKIVKESILDLDKISAPDFRFLQSKPKSPQVTIAGDSIHQLMENYRKINV